MDRYPGQIQYWLEGWQWIEVLDRPPAQWLARVLRALASAGVTTSGDAALVEPPDTNVNPAQEPSARPTNQGLAGLQALARFTDQIWPVPVDRVPQEARSGFRDIGEAQEDVQHVYRLKTRVCVAIESDRPSHLLLLDVGTSGKIYCLCPSIFAPDTRLAATLTYLPQAGSRYDAFVVSGRPGRENLLAILTDEPLGLDWMPADPKIPARVLSQTDIELLLARLRQLAPDRWTVLSTYFDVTD